MLVCAFWGAAFLANGAWVLGAQAHRQECLCHTGSSYPEEPGLLGLGAAFDDPRFGFGHLGKKAAQRGREVFGVAEVRAEAGA
jgi:hypothetical protein